MTSNELNIRNVFEIDGVHLFIREPNLIVLPIPDNRSGSNTSVKISVDFINNTPNSFYLSPDKTLILELLAPDGESLQAEVVPDDADIELNTNLQESWGFKLRRLIFNLTHFTRHNETSKPDPRLIEPKRGIYMTLTIKLLWVDNKLQLQFINDSTYLPSTYRINKCWSFNNLIQRAYKFRLVWDNFNSESDSQLQAETEIKATQFVNLHLIEPVGNNGNAIEVEGIRFETLLPEPTFILKKKKRGLKTCVQLGIRITNNTLEPAHFSFFATLIPQLIQSSGQQLKGYCYYRRRWYRGLASDFKLVMPGESPKNLQNQHPSLQPYAGKNATNNLQLLSLINLEKILGTRYKVGHMASNESNNNNTFETDSVRMEVSELSNLIVLPIPENTPSASIPTTIWLRITNNTSVPLLYYPCRSIIPKLIKVNKEMMPIETPIFGIRVNVDYQQNLINRLTNFISNIVKRLKRQNIKNPDYYLIYPKKDLLIDVNTNFLWQNNLLCCQISTNEYYSNIHPNYYNYWLFDGITSGFYQLQFSYYNINAAVQAEFDSGIREVINVEELSSCELATSSINLHLVQTASHDNKAIEANGVQFKIEMPEPILNVPFLLPGTKTSIKLGIRATNNTSIPLDFQRLSSLIPILRGDNGKIIEPDCDIMRLWVSEGPLYYSAMPGASTFFVLNSRLYRNFLNQLQLAIPNEAGGFWYFRNLKLGKYQLHFIYEVATVPTTMYQPEDSVSENLWTGCVVMPPVEFSIVR